MNPGKMSSAVSSVLIVTLCLFLQTSEQCSVTNWRRWDMTEILSRSDIVVYGKDVRHYEVNVTDSSLPGDSKTNAKFHVYCVYKNSEPGDLPENMTIDTVAPRTTCSGTEIAVGQEYIIGLHKNTDGSYVFHELNAAQSVAFEPSDANFQKVVNLCGLTNVTLPTGREPSLIGMCRTRSADMTVCSEPYITADAPRHFSLTAVVVLASALPALLPWLRLVVYI